MPLKVNILPLVSSLTLSKAFDSINHVILLNKLEYYGIRGVCLEWMRSYLNNRSQFVYLDDIKSSLLNISVGVPQGSILGPILFLLYINDVQYVSQLICPTIFADDTTLFLKGKSNK